MLNKIKEYWQLALGLLLAVVSGAYLIERSKRKSAEAVADNKEMLDNLNVGNKELAKNDGKLQSEEEKREEIRKDTNAAKQDDSGDASDFLSKR
jgi:hypothetical protein